MKQLLTTPFGTFLKGFISIILSLWLVELSSGHDLFSMDIIMVKKILTGAIVANLPVLINWVNPSYTQYGETEKNKNK
jgi:hypothetical protein